MSSFVGPLQSALRATAIILVLLDTGMRLNELLKMRLPNLDLEAGRAKIFGKGAKERFVYFGKSTKRALWHYISLARRQPEVHLGTRVMHHYITK